MKTPKKFTILSISWICSVIPATASSFENAVEAYEAEASAKSEIIREQLKPGATQNPEHWAKQYRERVHPKSQALQNTVQSNFYSMVQRPKPAADKIKGSRSLASERKALPSNPAETVNVDGSTVKKVYRFGKSGRK